MKEEGQRIYRIVLTGGPCSGKTSGITMLKQVFESKFIVFRPPELATLTFESGVDLLPSNYDPETHKEVIKEMCRQQMNQENFFCEIASLQKKDVIILFDRGVCDNFAYCRPDTVHKIMEETGWNWNYLCNERYDLVLHLVTAAKGA